MRERLLMAHSQAGPQEPPIRPSEAVQVVHRPMALSSAPPADGSARRATSDHTPKNYKPAHGMRHECFPERGTALLAPVMQTAQPAPRGCLGSLTVLLTFQNPGSSPLLTTFRALDWASGLVTRVAGASSHEAL